MFSAIIRGSEKNRKLPLKNNTGNRITRDYTSTQY